VLVRMEERDGEGSGLRFLAGRRSTRVRGIVLSALACLSSVACASCSKTIDWSPSISVDHDISPQPTRVGPATITIRLTDVARKPVTGAQIAIEGEMSHPGMSPVFGPARELEAGRYQGQIDFAMAGDWILIFQIRLPDGRSFDRQVSVPAVRAN
jgi:hypothetical protein